MASGTQLPGWFIVSAKIVHWSLRLCDPRTRSAGTGLLPIACNMLTFDGLPLCHLSYIPIVSSR